VEVRIAGFLRPSDQYGGGRRLVVAQYGFVSALVERTMPADFLRELILTIDDRNHDVLNIVHPRQWRSLTGLHCVQAA
jgi:hypothetical protein